MSTLTFASMIPKHKSKLRAEQFLEEMRQVLPWRKITQLIKPYYYNNKTGRQAHELMLMVKIYCLQQWYRLGDLSMEEAIYDRRSFAKFLDIDLMANTIPDETTILNFRHLLEEHDLTRQIFQLINKILEKKGLMMKEGTIVDATIISSPSSTKNKDGKRDPEMKSTHKHGQWYFGFKSHIGVDQKSGLTHTLEVTNAKTTDREKLEDLLHGEEKAIIGDKGYVNQNDKHFARDAGIYWGILDRRGRGKTLSNKQKKRNWQLSKVRAKVEHPFRIIKDLWGHRKTRYKGLKKNQSQMYMLFALANMFMARKVLLRAG